MKLTFLGFLKVAFSQLNRNKGRAFLTMLGIIIGVSSVILLVAIGNGLKLYIQKEFEDLGANMIFIMPGQVFEKGKYRHSDLSAMGGINFDEDDVKRIRKIPGVVAVSPLISRSESVSKGGKEILVEMVGVDSQFIEVRKLDLLKGRFLQPRETQAATRVAVLGYQAWKDIFGESSPLGKKITLHGNKYRVVGVVDKIGGLGSMGGGFDSRIYVPYKNLFKINGKKEFPLILLAVSDKGMIERVKEKVTAVMLKRYQEEDFSVVDQAEILSTVNSVLGVLTLALAGIAAISLLVGGVGIMNVMFISVTERIKEIGLRKAVGATSRHILVQFLLESTVLAALGGVIGIVFAAGVVSLMRKVFPAQITWWAVGLAFGVSSLIGIIFGVAPARKAARLSPIEALRYE
ncbi:ABC transporter permease [bacterium]|nr:ABC transporter permease [bacterium]